LLETNDGKSLKNLELISSFKKFALILKRFIHIKKKSMIALTVHLSDFLHPFLVYQRLKTTVNGQAAMGVERVLLIWIVDRPVRAFLNSLGCESLSPISENIYMRGKSSEFNATLYTYTVPHKENGAHTRCLFDHIRTQETYDDFGKILMESSTL